MEVFAGGFVEGVVVVVGLLPTALKNQFVRLNSLAYAFIGSAELVQHLSHPQVNQSLI